jgi:hypothetical protein
VLTKLIITNETVMYYAYYCFVSVFTIVEYFSETYVLRAVLELAFQKKEDT